MPCDYSNYPKEWKTVIRPAILARANDCCEACGAVNHQPHPVTGSRVVLTIAHLDHDTTNNDFSNLRAYCQKCHIGYDAKLHAHHARQTRLRKQREAGQGEFL